MGFRPRSRREALLYELCARGGYCGTGLTADDLTSDLSVDQIAELVLLGEGLDPIIDSDQCRRVARTVADCLFDPHGRGAGSGLPR